MPTLNLAIDASGAQQGARQFSESLKQAQAAAANTSKAVQNIDRRTSAMAKTVQAATRSLRAMVGGFTAIVAARAAFRTIADFESGLIGVGKTADLSGAQLEAMGQSVIDLSRRIPVATNELLEIAQSAGQLGVKGQANILAFTETVARLGRATDLAGAEAATALARILNVTGEATSNVAILGSVLVELGNNSAATEREIAVMTTQVAQATARFGVTSTEAAGMSAAMASLGIQAELAGSTMARAFIGIEQAIHGGGESFRELTRLTQLSGDELRRQFESNATEVFRRFVEGVGRATEEGRTLNDVLEQFNIAGVRDIRVLGTLSEEAGKLVESLKLAKNEQEDVKALTEESDTAFSTIKDTLNQIKNALSSAFKEFANNQDNLNTIKQLIIDIGKLAVPATERTVGFLGLWTEGVRELTEDYKKLKRELRFDDISDFTLIGMTTRLGIASLQGIAREGIPLETPTPTPTRHVFEQTNEELAEGARELGEFLDRTEHLWRRFGRSIGLGVGRPVPFSFTIPERELPSFRIPEHESFIEKLKVSSETVSGAIDAIVNSFESLREGLSLKAITNQVDAFRMAWENISTAFKTAASDASVLKEELSIKAELQESSTDFEANINAVRGGAQEGANAFSLLESIGSSSIGSLSRLFIGLSFDIENATNVLRTFALNLSQIAASEIFRFGLQGILSSIGSSGAAPQASTLPNLSGLVPARGQGFLSALTAPGLQHGGLINEPVWLVSQRTGRVAGQAGERGTEVVSPVRPAGDQGRGGGDTHFHFHGVTDADSFRRNRSMLSDFAQRISGSRRGFGRGV